MIRIAAILFMSIFSLTASSQRTIRGRVINEATGAAVPGSSVFISNTSKGTVSDGAGQFELLDVPPGKHELIISSIGFETMVFPFTESQLPLQLKIELKIKVRELQNVTVEPFVEEGWDKWGQTFMENFLGYTDNALRCKIKNEEIIKFRYFKKSNRLVAFADEPLRIENKSLGYNITYQLEDFEINFAEKSSVFMGYSLYEEMEKDKKVWQKRRDAAYYGSLMHFMRCLYTDSLKENGYELRRMTRTLNTEKERVRKLYRANQSTILSGNKVMVSQGHSGSFNEDSITYYNSTLRQPDYFDRIGKDLLSSDSVLVEEEGNHKALYFMDYLHVTYKKELESESYIKAQMQYRKPTYQRSWIVLTELNAVWIERNGNYYNPTELYFLGYWSWSDKIGDSLPLDFVPGK